MYFGNVDYKYLIKWKLKNVLLCLDPVTYYQNVLLIFHYSINDYSSILLTHKNKFFWLFVLTNANRIWWSPFSFSWSWFCTIITRLNVSTCSCIVHTILPWFGLNVSRCMVFLHTPKWQCWCITFSIEIKQTIVDFKKQV